MPALQSDRSRPRGLFLSWKQRHRIKDILAHPRFDPIKMIVASDGERILGLGDQGAGAMGIPIGKLSLYSACAGLHPATTLPVLLDTGTDNAERLADPIYIGGKHERLRGQEYDDFVEAFVTAVKARWSHVLLQWEDFARANAGRLLARYRDRLCTFNDDIQGTAAVATGALLAAVEVTGVPLREQRIVIVGAGSAGCGIGALILREIVDAGVPAAQAKERFFAVDRDGLLVQGMPGTLDFQQPFVRREAAVAGWSSSIQAASGSTMWWRTRSRPCSSACADSPASSMSGSCAPWRTRLRARSSSRCRIRSRAARRRPRISRPGLRAAPWSAPAARSHRSGAAASRSHQTNNAYIFPGVGLGVIAVKARRVSQGMFKAAACALAQLSPARRDASANLLPPVADLRRVAIAVAQAVARQARDEGLCQDFNDHAIAARIAARMWAPIYLSALWLAQAAMNVAKVTKWGYPRHAEAANSLRFGRNRRTGRELLGSRRCFQSELAMRSRR